MKREIKLIALGSTRMVGKDTFYTLLSRLYPDRFFTRYAFADQLKDYCNPLCRSIFNRSIHNLTPEEKEMFRPILIETGKICRSLDIDYWVKRTYEKMQRDSMEYPSVPSIAVASDLRFTNEYVFLKNIYEDSMVYVDIERIGAPEPTEEEKKHSPELKKLADDRIIWPSDPTIDSLIPTVANFYNKYFN
jgi:hypothetical protein